MKDELFKKVYIKTKDDLPKEDGFYPAHIKDDSLGNDYKQRLFQKGYIDYWLENIDWYLQHIEEQECDHPFAFVQSRCFGEINHCLKCGKDL